MNGVLTINIIFLLSFQISFSQGLNLPLYSNFDSKNDREFWKEYRLGNKHLHSWDFSNAITYTKPYSLFHDYPLGNHITDTVYDYMVSPPLDLKNGGVIYFQMIIFSANRNQNNSDKFCIYLGNESRNPKLGKFSEFINLNNYADNSSKWKEIKLMIPPQNDSCFIALYYQATNEIFTVNIDNLIIQHTDVKENINANSVVLFSNPYNQKKHFDVKFEGQLLLLNLYDLEGKCLISQTIENGKNKFKKKLEPGVYDLKITDITGEIKQHQKLIISN